MLLFVRTTWTTGSKCEVYSKSKNAWFDGTVDEIIIDEEGEWLQIKYNETRIKQIQRFSSDIRAYSNETRIKQIQRFSSDIRAYSNPNTLFNFHDLQLTLKDTQTLIDGYNHRSIPVELNGICVCFLYLNPQITRERWTIGSTVEVFSNSRYKWFTAEITDLIEDEEGEWLNCVFSLPNGTSMSKQVQRDSSDIRAIATSTTECEKRSDVHKVHPMIPIMSRGLPPSLFLYPATGTCRKKRKLMDIDENGLIV
eukprot:622238_1